MIVGPFQIAEKFNITDRGTVVVISQITNLPVGKLLKAIIASPNGTHLIADAHKEWLLQRSSQPLENEAYLLRGIEKEQIIDGSSIEITEI
nr:hypothetical protein [uncultured Undibacterium sp.]